MGALECGLIVRKNTNGKFHYEQIIFINMCLKICYNELLGIMKINVVFDGSKIWIHSIKLI